MKTANGLQIESVLVSGVLILLLLFLTSTFALSKMYTVKGNKVNLRSGPDISFAIKWQYGEGFPLKLLSKNKNWYQVEDFEGDSGWVHKSLLQDSPQQVIVRVNKGSEQQINIRDEPSLQGDVIGKAHYGVVFKKLGERNGWINVEHESGLNGWVKNTLLWGY